jgi:hypothetical protein
VVTYRNLKYNACEFIELIFVRKDDLITGRQVGVKVVLPVEGGHAVDLGVDFINQFRSYFTDKA